MPEGAIHCIARWCLTGRPDAVERNARALERDLKAWNVKRNQVHRELIAKVFGMEREELMLDHVQSSTLNPKLKRRRTTITETVES